MATIRDGWKMPDPPEKMCPCGQRCSVPEAFLDGDEWYFFWECPQGCGEFPESMDLWVGIWPFVEDYATPADMEAAGFTVNW